MHLVTLFPLLLGLCLCYGTNGELPSVDTMKTGVTNFAELHSGLKDAKPKQIINSVGNMLTMVPAPCFQIFGVTLLLFSALIDDSTPKTATKPTTVVDNTEVLAKLDQIKGSVLTLMRSVEQMGQELEIKISEQTVLEKERSLRVLSDLFVALQKTRSRTYWNIMKQSCIQVNFFGLPGFFRDELLGTAPTSSGFMKELRENQEYTKYERGIHRLIGGFYTASLMLAACTVITSEVNNVPALIANIKDIDKLVENITDDLVFNSESGSIFKTTIDYNKKLLNDMIKEINASVDAVRKDFEWNSFTWAKNLVVKEGTFMNQTNETNNTKIAESLYTQLSEKYPWRPWMVAVHDHRKNFSILTTLAEKDESNRTYHYSSAIHAFDKVIKGKMIVIASVESDPKVKEKKEPKFFKGYVSQCDKIFSYCDSNRIKCKDGMILRREWNEVAEELGKCVRRISMYFGYFYAVEFEDPHLVVKTSEEMKRFVYNNTVDYGTYINKVSGGARKAVIIFTY